jgi:glycosyltransferase involved in cell wall biosynthesis
MATLYVPHAEDFGMSPVESMSAGKPVIGVAEGGLLETMIHGETGILIPSEFRSSPITSGYCRIDACTCFDHAPCL